MNGTRNVISKFERDIDKQIRAINQVSNIRKKIFIEDLFGILVLVADGFSR